MRRRRPIAIPEVSTPLSPGQSVRIKAPRRSAIGSVIGHTGFSVARYHSTAVFGAIFPVVAGLLVFGWRAGVTLLVILTSTAAAGAIWRRIGERGHPLRPAQLLWLALVLGLMLPADLAAPAVHNHAQSWPIIPAAALLLVIFSWGIGNFCPGRLHPAVVVFLVMALLYGPMLKSRAVLQRNHLLTGDIVAAVPAQDPQAIQIAWGRRPLDSAGAISANAPAVALMNFTKIRSSVSTGRGTLETLLRDRLPPLEDLVLGACPGPIGATSAIFVIVGGLFLLYRGLLDFRIPLLITATAWLAWLVLPLPALTSEPGWRWLPGHVPGVGWASGVTFANYQVLGSPLLFTAFFLAGSPTVRPMVKPARTAYAVLIGGLTAVIQLYVSVALGSYIALLAVGLLTPALDRFLAPRSLV